MKATPPRRIDVWIKRLALALLAPLAVLAVAESGLRLCNGGYPTAFLVREGAFWHSNPFFGYRFFPPRLARTPAPLSIEKPKPQGTFRVFVLGSSAAMGDPQPAFGLPRMLETVLRRRFPRVRVEVHNAAMTAINSHVIREIARDVSRFEPDAFILYMGNNEIVGPFGPGTVLTGRTETPPASRLRVLASRLRINQLIRRAKDAIGMRPEDDREWAGLEMFASNRIARDDPRLGNVYRAFEVNLRDIVRTASASGAAVVLCTVGVNLADCAPFASPDADLKYRQGRLHLRSGRAEESLGLLREARDLDALRVRADGRIDDIIRAAASDGPPRLHLLDCERRLNESASAGVAGREFFLDHVHLTLRGSHLLAGWIADALAPEPALKASDSGANPAFDECLAAMLYSPFAEAQILGDMLERRRRPPFAQQAGNLDQVMELARRLSGLPLSPEQYQLLSVAVLGHLQREPEDPWIPYAAADASITIGRYEAALSFAETAVRIAPHWFDARGTLALALGYLGRAADGIRAAGDPRREGHYPLAILLDAARTLKRDGRLPEAIAYLEEVLRHDPDNAYAGIELANALAHTGRVEAAEALLRRLMAADPTDPMPREELAILLAVHGPWIQADALFADLARRFPDRAEWRLKQAVALLIAGEGEQARGLLEDAVRVAPDNAAARMYLARLLDPDREGPELRALLERALDLDPYSAEVHRAYARQLTRDGDELRANEHIEIAGLLDGRAR